MTGIEHRKLCFWAPFRTLDAASRPSAGGQICGSEIAKATKHVGPCFHSQPTDIEGRKLEKSAGQRMCRPRQRVPFEQSGVAGRSANRPSLFLDPFSHPSRSLSALGLVPDLWIRERRSHGARGSIFSFTTHGHRGPKIGEMCRAADVSTSPTRPI